MKKVLSILFYCLIANSAISQNSFKYNTYINGIWGEWNASNSTHISSYAGFHVYVKGKLSDLIIYQNHMHPSKYFVRIQSKELAEFLSAKDYKKKLNELFKNGNQKSFLGTIEFSDPLKYTKDEGSIKTFLESFPLNLPVDAKSSQNVEIVLMPFKKDKDPKILNIFFENDIKMGFALVF